MSDQSSVDNLNAANMSVCPVYMEGEREREMIDTIDVGSLGNMVL